MAEGGALLESKLSAPRRRRDLVSRARLDAMFGQTDLPAVVLVSAPAGFGKSTLLTTWAAASDHVGHHVAWLSLDRRDNDPVRFWTYLIGAVRKVAAGFGTYALETLQSSPAALEDAVGVVTNDLLDLGDIIVVIDDYHVIESLEVHESMTFLIEHLPARAHLVVASRADPPWPLSDLRARRELLEVRAADLRFTPEEVSVYLNEISMLDLTASDVEALATRTEGWPAALQLAALSLDGRDDPSAFVEQFAGDDRFVVDYLADEVLDRQDGAVRTFLLETSILSRLTAPLCDAVTGRTDARAMLDLVDRSNLFLVALDDRRGWYRYHHLFGEVLRARLLDESPARVAALHRRATRWFVDAGDRAEAIRHALAAGDVAHAAELIELAVTPLRRTRQEATLASWFDALPAEIFVHRPVLTLGAVGVRMSSGQVDGVDAQLDAVDRWLDPGFPADQLVVHDHDEFRRLPAQVAMYRAALALLRGDLASVIDHGEHAAVSCAADDHLGRGAAAALVGLARWTDGDLVAAGEHYGTAIDELSAAGHLSDALGCSLGLSDIEVGRGRLAAAEAILRAGLDLAALSRPVRGTADMHVGLAEIHLERNELDAAADELRRSLDVGDRFGLGQHAHRWRVVDARLCSIRGEHDAALALLSEAGRRYDTDYSPRLRPIDATIARARLQAGDVAGARRWATTAEVAVDDELVFTREYEHLTLARVLLAAGGADDAVPLLERLLDAADAGGRMAAAAEAELLLALAADEAGDTARAVTLLEAALVRAWPERHARMFLDAGAPAIGLLRTAIRHGRAVDQAEELLAMENVSAPPMRSNGLIDPLSARELDVLRLLRSDLTGPEIATELVVSLNTVRTHTKHIFTKLGATNRRAAVRRADELGL